MENVVPTILLSHENSFLRDTRIVDIEVETAITMLYAGKPARFMLPFVFTCAEETLVLHKKQWYFEQNR